MGNEVTNEFHREVRVDFLLITALPEEQDAVLNLLDGYGLDKTGRSFLCYRCNLPVGSETYTIVLTQLAGMGNVEAAIHATQTIEEFEPCCVLMVGIAGGIRERVKLGDVIVADQIVYYELAKRTPRRLEPRLISVAADPLLLQHARNYQRDAWRDVVPSSGTRPAIEQTPGVHFGPLAVGDKVVADGRFASDLMALHPKLVGIEMESYGVARAAAVAVCRPRFLAIRGVSDFADEDKNDGHRHDAAAAAAAFTIGFLRSVSSLMSSLHGRSGDERAWEDDPLIVLRHLSMQYIPPQRFIASLPPGLLARTITEVVVDQTDLYRAGHLVDPVQAAQRQAGVPDQIDALLRSTGAATVLYGGIAHIPLLFHLGHRLTNKRRLEFFELNRYTGDWEQLEGKARAPKLMLEGLPRHVREECSDVVLRVGISDSVSAADVSEIVPAPIGSLHLHLIAPTRDVLVGRQQMEEYGARFRRALDGIHRLFPNRERTHVFYAGPASLAVYFGQLISHTIDRRVLVYNYSAQDSPRYSWGLEITTGTDEPGFLMRSSKTRKVKEADCGSKKENRKRAT